MHMTGLSKDPVTKQEIPPSVEQIEFANRALNYGDKKHMIKELANALKKRSETERRREIKNIAFTLLPDLENDYLPKIPKDRMEWEMECRPTIKGEPNRLPYLPMMREIVLDNWNFVFWLLARQWGKTTNIGSDLAYDATTNFDYDQMYINFSEPTLKTFVTNKFRQDVFGKGPLSHYVSGVSRLGSEKKMILKTRCVIDMMLPGIKWINVQGKSNKKMTVDEGQDENWDGFHNAQETLTDTAGRTLIAGIGGVEDSAYHNIYKSTDQREWIFDDGDEYMDYENMSWRKNLEFDEHGLVYNKKMNDVMSGHYKITKPENSARHGYWLPQTYNPRIPITIKSAVEDYKLPEYFSIEYKLKDINYTEDEIQRNVFARFVAGQTKPITIKDMKNLFDDTVSLTMADDVDFELGPVLVGIDWGGGGKTIIWIWQCVNEEAPIFKLLWVEKVETNDLAEQQRICFDLIDAYEADFISMDAGGASDRVQAMQKRYGNRSVRISYNVRPEIPQPTKKEYKKQLREMRYRIDRTFSMNRIISLIKRPYNQDGKLLNRIILPGADYEKVKWIINQFVAIEAVKEYLKATGQKYIKYIHKDSEPDDAFQACNYNFTGFWDVYRRKNKEHYNSNIDYDPDVNSFDEEDVM